MDGRWQFTVAPYFWFAGLDASVSVKGITEVPVKVSRVGLTGRTDFSGVASGFTWNAQGALNVSLGQRWTVGAGYRYFDLNYEKGDAAQPQLYKVAYGGQVAFVAYSW